MGLFCIIGLFVCFVPNKHCLCNTNKCNNLYYAIMICEIIQLYDIVHLVNVE